MNLCKRIVKRIINYFTIFHRLCTNKKYYPGFFIILLTLSFAIIQLLLPRYGLNSIALSQTIDTTYTNPVGTAEGPIELGDPFVILYEKNYYLYATSAGDGFKCWTSTDLVHWTALGYAFRSNEKSWGGGSFWAPEVTYYRGKFFMVYSAYQRNAPRGGAFFRLCLAVSDKPEGPFTDLHAPWCDMGEPCIDGHIFIDDDSAPYLYFARNYGRDHNSQGYLSASIYGMKLSPDLSTYIGEPILCAEADQEWENPRSMDTRCNEGPFVFKHDGIYYMTYSANNYVHPFYGIGYATSPKPLGAWTKSANNPLVQQNSETGVAGPGHNSLTISPDGKELFMVYHTHGDAKKMKERVLNIDRLVIDEKGGLKLIGPTRSPQPLPSGARHQ